MDDGSAETEALIGISSEDGRSHLDARNTAAEFKVYKRRWFILFVLCLLNCSNAMAWLTFAPVADQTAQYLRVSLNLVNWLSLVYIVVAVFFSLITTWVLDTLGLRFSAALYLLLLQALAKPMAESPLSVCATGTDANLSWTVPVLVMAGLCTLGTCCFVGFFHTDYRRLRAEATASPNRVTDHDCAFFLQFCV
uniref:Uncharacterized protein n=1 Tax=Sinocyclocheilus rhinocerous TaxID=307959 RepID=A0A673I521_9TELE